MNTVQKIKLIECPRDAMQGWKYIIPTEKKTEYINSLLKVGFDTIDFGSFVSQKAIPQMADTKEVLKGLHVDQQKTKLLSIVANLRGAEQACEYDEITYLGFPFSVSETFQKRNTNSSIQESFQRVEEIQNICFINNKELIIYISMGFGNPYEDPYNEALVVEWINKIITMDVKIISLADTVGLATPEQIGGITSYLVKSLPGIEIGVHLHSAPYNWKEKVEVALLAGCRRFDGALKGFGGCPMANNELVGNMDTERMIPYFKDLNLLDDLDMEALIYSSKLAAEIFI